MRDQRRAQEGEIGNKSRNIDMVAKKKEAASKPSIANLNQARKST